MEYKRNHTAQHHQHGSKAGKSAIHLQDNRKKHVYQFQSMASTPTIQRLNKKETAAAATSAVGGIGLSAGLYSMATSAATISTGLAAGTALGGLALAGGLGYLAYSHFNKPSTKKKKKDEWRTGSLDDQIKTAKKTPKAVSLEADTGHHKVSKKKMHKLFLQLDQGEQQKLGVSSHKQIKSLRSNLTFGPNSSTRSDDPAHLGRDDAFDPNTQPDGSMTPRSREYHEVDKIIDAGVFDKGAKARAIAHIKKAEQLHKAKVGSESEDQFDTDLSMWEKGKGDKPYRKKYPLKKEEGKKKK